MLRPQQIGVVTRPWRAPMIGLATVLITGAIGYHITEGWDWGDCLWMVMITITTIGYGEVQPLSPAGRLVTVLIIAGGVVVVQLTVQKVLGLTESGYFRELRELRFRRILRRMHNHVILCGYGRIGREIAKQLAREKIPLLVIEIDLAQKLLAESHGHNVLHADATLDETLLEAGLERCRSLVLALPNDATTLYVILSARSLSKQCRMIARADNEESANKLKLAGAKVVVSPYVAGGKTMAASAIHGAMSVGLMDLLAGSDFGIEEFHLSHDPLRMMGLIHCSFAELQIIQRSGVLLLAVRDGSNLIANPSEDHKIAPGQMLVVLGSKSQLAHFRDLLGDAVESIEAMPI